MVSTIEAALRKEISRLGLKHDPLSRGLRVWQLGAWKAAWWCHEGSTAVFQCDATSREAALSALLRVLEAVTGEKRRAA